MGTGQVGRICLSKSSMVTSFDEYLRYIDEVPRDDEIRVTVDCCLAAAEEAFGALETGWDYQVELRESPAHPETVVVGPGKVRIYLTAGRSRVGYIFEAGHEAVHCLNPSNHGETFLEEAVAVAFSLRMTENRFGPPGLDRCKLTEKYERAVRLAATIDDDVVGLGRRLRGHVGNLGKVSLAAVKELYPHVPEPIVRQVLEEFPRQGS